MRESKKRRQCARENEDDAANTYQMDNLSFNVDSVELAVQYGFRIRPRTQDFRCGTSRFSPRSVSVQLEEEFLSHLCGHQIDADVEQFADVMLSHSFGIRQQVCMSQYAPHSSDLPAHFK